ncbi:MAG: hypothetical protein KF902_07660 [Phycisphaeraceae bacterium]|nr:hypothetical protein [Phycisphaeraceae bacterium]
MPALFCFCGVVFIVLGLLFLPEEVATARICLAGGVAFAVAGGTRILVWALFSSRADADPLFEIDTEHQTLRTRGYRWMPTRDWRALVDPGSISEVTVPLADLRHVQLTEWRGRTHTDRLFITTDRKWLEISRRPADQTVRHAFTMLSNHLPASVLDGSQAPRNNSFATVLFAIVAICVVIWAMLFIFSEPITRIVQRLLDP